MLKKLSATASRKQASTVDLAKAKARAAAIANLSQGMRAAAQYLAEFAREINSIKPGAACAYDYVYLGRVPRVALAEAWSDSRSRRLEGNECCDHVLFRYRIRPDPLARVELQKDDIARCESYLTANKTAFRKQVVATNEFGEATRAAFTVSGGLLCELELRADYDVFAIAVELKNVRRPGTVRCRVAAGELAGLPDDFGRYVLGADDDFEKRMRGAPGNR